MANDIRSAAVPPSRDSLPPAKSRPIAGGASTAPEGPRPEIQNGTVVADYLGIEAPKGRTWFSNDDRADGVATLGIDYPSGTECRSVFYLRSDAKVVFTSTCGGSNPPKFWGEGKDIARKVLTVLEAAGEFGATGDPKEVKELRAKLVAVK